MNWWLWSSFCVLFPVRPAVCQDNDDEKLKAYRLVDPLQLALFLSDLEHARLRVAQTAAIKVGPRRV